ncbi:MAG: DUF3307 domain-containing protein [Anaerolineae bacterium]|jgi:hypothetical protein
MLGRLVLAHLFADFVLQTRWLVVRKRTLAGLAAHAAIVGLAMVPVTWDRLDRWWPWLLVVTAIHAALDWAKLRLEQRLGRATARRLPPIVPFLADQALHLLTLAAAVALAGAADASTLDWQWWVASAYLAGTFGLSIALPLWLDPPSLMRRPAAARLTVMVTSALVLTLAWRGWPVLIPLVGLVLYHAAARRLGRQPVTATFPIEFWAAVALSASLGWMLTALP